MTCYCGSNLDVSLTSDNGCPRLIIYSWVLIAKLYRSYGIVQILCCGQWRPTNQSTITVMKYVYPPIKSPRGAYTHTLKTII